MTSFTPKKVNATVLAERENVQVRFSKTCKDLESSGQTNGPFQNSSGHPMDSTLLGDLLEPSPPSVRADLPSLLLNSEYTFI